MNVRAQNYVAAAAAIAPIWPAFRDEFFASKTDATAPAVSGLRKNFDPIDEHEAGNLPCLVAAVYDRRNRGLTSSEVGSHRPPLQSRS